MRTVFGYAPGLVWAAVIVFLVFVSDWLLTYFGAVAWVKPLAGLLVAVIVPVLRLLAQGAEPASRATTASRSTLNRFLW